MHTLIIILCVTQPDVNTCFIIYVSILYIHIMLFGALENFVRLFRARENALTWSPLS